MNDDYELDSIANGSTNAKTAITILAVRQKQMEKQTNAIPDMQTILGIMDSRLKMIEKVAYGLIGAIGLALIAGIMKLLLK